MGGGETDKSFGEGEGGDWGVGRREFGRSAAVPASERPPLEQQPLTRALMNQSLTKDYSIPLHNWTIDFRMASSKRCYGMWISLFS